MYNLESFITRHDENLYKLKDDVVFNMILHFWQAFSNLCDTFFNDWADLLPLQNIYDNK